MLELIGRLKNEYNLEIAEDVYKRQSGYSAFNATPEEIIHTLINEIKKQLQVNYNAK